MRRLALFTVVTLVCLAGAVEQCHSATPPENARSRSVVARVRPVLEKELAARQLAFGSPVFMRIFKEPKELEVWVLKGARYELFKTYKVHTYSGKLGPKQREGDQQAPEGFYFVAARAMNPNSSYHLSFNLGYPNAYDKAHGRTGSALMVHGSTVSIGCFAMTDPRIEEIYTLADGALRGGQPFFRVHIFPFRMSDENLKAHAGTRWDAFWLNLKAGYDHFEKEKVPPDVGVKDGKYVFTKEAP